MLILLINSSVIAETPSEYLAQGNSLYDKDQCEPAITAYDKAVRLDPKNLEALNGKGKALKCLGRYEDAIKLYDQAINIDPNYTKAWNNKGNALTYLGRYEEAIENFDRSLDIDPDYAKAWSNRAWSLNLAGKFDDALISAENATTLLPSYALGWCNKGDALRLLGRYDKAVEAYNEALKRDSWLEEAHEGREAALSAKENLGSANDSARTNDSEKSPFPVIAVIGGFFLVILVWVKSS